MPSIAIVKLHPSLGAEVLGVDLSLPIVQDVQDAFSEAQAEHLALMFRDQTLTPGQYLRAARAFGPPMRQRYSQHNMHDFPDIGLIWRRNGRRPAERWHTDDMNREKPPAATILYGVEISSSGGGASVANMRSAYNPLPAAERARLDAMKTVNGLDDGKDDTRPEDKDRYDRPIIRPWRARIRSTARARCISTCGRRNGSRA